MTGMPKVLDGSHLSIEDVVAVAREGETVELAPQSEAAIRRCRELLERKMQAGEIMYGINTGIGELAEVQATHYCYQASKLNSRTHRHFNRLPNIGLNGVSPKRG